MERNQRLQKAQDFIWCNARLIERYLFTFLFANGSREPVLSALRAYQNEDGGFGNALEPDKRCPSSQPQDIEIALHILDAINAMNDPMVEHACDYLITITTPEARTYALDKCSPCQLYFFYLKCRNCSCSRRCRPTNIENICSIVILENRAAGCRS